MAQPEALAAPNPTMSAPRVINVDKNAAYPKAIAELKAARILPEQVELRQVKYLNNLIEQDHRFIKRLVKPGLGFFSFESAWRTLQGYEVMNMIRKGQVHGVGKGDQTRSHSSPACLEWLPKLNRKVCLHVHGIPPRVTELSEDQRFVLKQMVGQHASARFAAIFALGYWAGLRISEIAAASVMDQCTVNQRAGTITLIDAKGGKTRTLDLHNMARRALYEYLYPTKAHELERDPESVYVFTSQRAAWLRQQGRPDHLSERGIEHLWMQVKHKGTNAEWKLIAEVTFHDLRHDFAHRARQSGWLWRKLPSMLATRPKMAHRLSPRQHVIPYPVARQLKERIQDPPG